MKFIIHAFLFSFVLHLIIIGGGFAYLEFQKRQALKQGAFASGYGFQFSGGSLLPTLIISFVAVAVLYLAVRASLSFSTNGKR
ncbi:hypothetical protein [Paenibacillus humicus]|uniref:hypothetical protein n=1 Tax=Paenibacillus humicus TaxID=412861 RepID=UPI003F18952C